MSRLLFVALLMTGFFTLALPAKPAKAGDFPTVTNVHPSGAHRYTKQWRKRGKTRRYRKRRYRSYRPRRESRDYLVTFPHTHVDTGTNF